MVMEQNFAIYLVKSLLLKHLVKRQRNILSKHGLISKKLITVKETLLFRVKFYTKLFYLNLILILAWQKLLIQ